MKFCCTSWLALSVELRELKQAELDKLVKKGIPNSVFAPLNAVLNSMSNHCPVCGAKLNLLTGEVSPVIEPTPTPVLKKKATPRAKCPRCNGTGKLSLGGESINCMNCHGTGFISGDTHVEDDGSGDEAPAEVTA